MWGFLGFLFYNNNEFDSFKVIQIFEFERKISLIIVFVLNKIVFKKIIRDFRFYFVGVN